MKLIVIGTGSDANIRLKSPFVSSYHAELLLLDNGDILLTDKGSKNGTYLNDRKLQPNKEISIKRGDVVRFADQPLDWRNVPIIDLSDIKEMRGIGTNFRNRYQLDGERVGQFHATLKKKSDGKWYIQDHSKSGTTVNGQAIPTGMDVKLKRGDRILCAGVQAPNPYGKGPSMNFRRIIPAVSVVLLLILGVFVFSHKEDIGSLGKMTDEQIYVKYKNSTVFLVGAYYYKVSAGNLDLEKLGLPTEVIISEDGLQEVRGLRSNMHIFTGTGFFVSADGKIVTNLHIARPWLFSDESSLISDQYRMYLESVASENNTLLRAYISQIKVEGVLSYIGIIPNGAYFSEENLRPCRELVGHDDTMKDVAILQLDLQKLPYDGCSFIDIDRAVTEDAKIKVGEHIYTMGFPYGLSLQDLKSSNGLQILANGGSVTQECTEYSFGFNAPSYHGASGSPIFNAKGRLIGVLSSGVEEGSGFNYAIKAVYAKELLEKTHKR